MIRDTPDASKDYTYLQDFWKPEPDAYETSSEGWNLYKDQNAVDMQALREYYPELSSWENIERMNAWAGFCSDCNFTAWTEPSRTEQFLLYLRLSQDRQLPDCSDDPEAIYRLIMAEVKA